jgi:DNA polymerase-1
VSVLDSVSLNLVESFEEVEAFRRWLSERRPILGLDIETSGLSLARDRIRLVQFGDGKAGWAIPYDEWRGVIRETLATYSGPIVLQHAKFDAGFLTRDGLPFPWERTHDTMVMSFLVNSMGPRSLKPAAALYVDPVARAGESELKKAMAAHGWDYGTIPVDLPAYWGYSAADTILTALLAEKLWPRVQYARGAYDLEMACERVLCGMELRGARIDVDYCEATAAHLRADIDAACAELPFNPFSAREVEDALRADGVELTKRTASGGPALDEEVLKSIDHPYTRSILFVRSQSKVLSTYFEAFLREQKDGRVHPHIKQLQAKTGRMSVTDPPLQTLPRRSAVRDAFIPSDGNLLVLADYDGQELRILAHLSGDEQMLDDFAAGRDLHLETARGAYGPNAGKRERSVCKNANYARVYGGGAERIAVTAGVDVASIMVVFRAFDERYPKATQLMADITAAVRERAAAEGSDYGWVQLEDGRHLRVPKDKAYVGLNYRIQGAGASVLKRALVDLDAADLGDYLILPVHDEVVLDVPESDVEDAIPVIRGAMERHDFKVPLTIDTTVVSRWGEKYREEAE